jgi:hypothetical protein
VRGSSPGRRPRSAAAAPLFAALLAAAGCAQNLEYWQTAGTPKAIRLGPDDRVLVLPAKRTTLPGGEVVAAPALEGAFAAAFAQDRRLPGLEGELAAAGLEALSSDLALGMAHGALEHREDIFDERFIDVPSLLSSLLELLRQKYPYPVRYIAAAHVEEKETRLPNTARLEATGGLYDIDARRMISVVRYREDVPRDQIEASLPKIGEKIGRLTLCPTLSKQCED